MQKGGTELQFQWVLMNWCRTPLSTAPVMWYTYHQLTMNNQSWTQVAQGRYCLRLATHGVSSQNPDHLVRWNLWKSARNDRQFCLKYYPENWNMMYSRHTTDAYHVESLGKCIHLGFLLNILCSKKRISQFLWVVWSTINCKIRWYVKRAMRVWVSKCRQVCRGSIPRRDALHGYVWEQAPPAGILEVCDLKQ